MITVIEYANKTGTRRQRSAGVDIDQTLNPLEYFPCFPSVSLDIASLCVFQLLRNRSNAVFQRIYTG